MRVPLVTLMQPEELADLTRAAAADGHVVVAPTHLARKDGEIVGYASIGGIMLINTWAHSRKLVARESFGLLFEVERIAAAMGAKEICLPCSADSPFARYIHKLGYAQLGMASYNIKALSGVPGKN